jgi:glycosyltransferase involved in cell wall biosynthesis
MTNVSFLGLQPDAVHASLLRAADVLLLSESPQQVDMSLPSKLTSYFAARRPIVAAVPTTGASASEIRRSEAGLLVRPDDTQGLLGALRALRADRALAERLAAAGPGYAEANTSPAACLAAADNLVTEIASTRSRRPELVPGR